jgi:ATP-dependent Lon protease
MSETLVDVEERQDDIAFPATLPVLPLKDTVVFPESVTPLAIGQERSIKLVEDVVSGERVLALVTVKNPDAEQPGWDDLYEVGTAAVIHKMIKVPDGTLRILVQGVKRIKLDRTVLDDPYLVGEFVELPDDVKDTPEVEALTRNVQNLFARVIGLVPYLPEELQIAAANVDDPSALCNLVASTLRLKTEEKQRLLELTDIEARLRDISAILNRELEVFELGSKIQSQVQEEMEKGQREFFLRQQLKAIQDELGESDPEAAEIAELRSTFESMELPEDVRKVVDRELGRLERLPTAAAEYGVIRTYLDWIAFSCWRRKNSRWPFSISSCTCDWILEPSSKTSSSRFRIAEMSRSRASMSVSSSSRCFSSVFSRSVEATRLQSALGSSTFAAATDNSSGR